MPARVYRRPTSPSRGRTAASATRGPSGAVAGPATAMESGHPGELGLRQTGLSFVLDPEGVDAGALRLRHGQVRAHGVEHPGEADGLTRVDTERDDVLDLEVDGVADLDGVAQAVLLHLDGRPLNPEHLAHEGR